MRNVARVVEIVPPRFAERLPAAVVEIVPVLVVEIVPVLVVEMVPVLEKPGIEMTKTIIAEQQIHLIVFIESLLVASTSGVTVGPRFACQPSLGRPNK